MPEGFKKVDGWRGMRWIAPPPAPVLTTDYLNKRAKERQEKEAANAARKRRKMSENSVEWCEADGWENGHAFSTKDPDAERIRREHKEKKLRGYAPGPVYQEEEIVDESYWICGPHKREYGLFQRANKEPKELPKKDREYDPEYVENLIKENERLDRLLGTTHNQD